MTKEQRVVGESGTRTWRGRQGQARQGLEDHVGKVGLYLKAKRNGRVVYFNLCVQDCGGSEILCYLQIHELICYRLTDPDRRLLGETKSFPLAAKAVRFAPVLHMPKAPGGKEGRCGCLHVQRVVIHKWTPELGRFPAFVVSRSTPAP